MKYTFFLILFFVALYGCNKDEMKEVALEYTQCPCEHATNINNYPFMREDILLFDTDKVSWEQMIKLSSDSKSGAKFISVNLKSGEAIYIEDYGTMGARCQICNFPSLNRDIPLNGIKVSCHGHLYDTCEPKIGFYSYSTVVLTSLKIQVK